MENLVPNWNFNCCYLVSSLVCPKTVWWESSCTVIILVAAKSRTPSALGFIHSILNFINFYAPSFVTLSWNTRFLGWLLQYCAVQTCNLECFTEPYQHQKLLTMSDPTSDILELWLVKIKIRLIRILNKRKDLDELQKIIEYNEDDVKVVRTRNL